MDNRGRLFELLEIFEYRAHERGQATDQGAG